MFKVSYYTWKNGTLANMVFVRMQRVGQSRCRRYYTSLSVVARYRSKEPEKEQAGELQLQTPKGFYDPESQNLGTTDQLWYLILDI